jgi:hypothetical protein
VIPTYRTLTLLLLLAGFALLTPRSVRGAEPAPSPVPADGADASPAASPASAEEAPVEQPTTPTEPAPSEPPPAEPSAEPSASAAPGAAPPPSYSPPPVPPAGPAPTASYSTETVDTDWRFWGGVITAAAGVTFLVVGHYALFRINDAVREDAMKDYRATVLDGESSCDAARDGYVLGAGAPQPGPVEDLCDEVEALEIVRNVAIPVGAVATAVGLLFLGTSETVNGPDRDDEQARSWRLHVGAGPSGASAAVTVVF